MFFDCFDPRNISLKYFKVNLGHCTKIQVAKHFHNILFLDIAKISDVFIRTIILIWFLVIVEEPLQPVGYVQHVTSIQ